MKLNDFTWEEVENIIKNGANQLIIPVGTCEQHGRHLPISTDTVTAEYFADYLSEKFNLLVAPTINYGVNLPCDICFSGTSSITEKTLKDHIIEITSWWEKQGFTKFHFITAHGDLFHIQALHGNNNRRIFVYELYESDFNKHLNKQLGCKHACEAETSILLYLFPDLVRKNKIEDFCTPEKEFIPYLKHKVKEPIKNSPGNQGYPTFATKKKGEKIVAQIEDDLITKFTQNSKIDKK